VNSIVQRRAFALDRCRADRVLHTSAPRDQGRSVISAQVRMIGIADFQLPIAD